MRAVRVAEHGGPEVLETVERPRPEPGPGEVRVAIRAAGLNFADVEQRRGNYPEGPTPPFVPGLEAAGRVDMVGDGVERSVGESVVCLTGETFAEYTVADADRVFQLPPGVGMEDAAGVPVQFLTAHNCLYGWGGLEGDQTVLVLAAAGGVGSAAVQLAREGGATVLGAASGRKLGFVRSLGADHAIDYERRDLVSVEDRLDTRVDLVLDGVGGSAFQGALEVLAPGGRIVTYGMASGRPGSVATPRLFFDNKAVIGYHLGKALDRVPGRVLAAREPLYDQLDSGALSVHVDRRFELTRVRAACERLETRSNRGKVLIEP